MSFLKRTRTPASSPRGPAYPWTDPDRRDADAASRVRAGETEWFATLVDAWSRPIHAFFACRGVSAEQAADLTQEAFLRAFRGLAGFDGTRSSFRTWLFTIALNLHRDHLRRKAARGGPPVALGDEDPPDPEPDPASAAEDRDGADRLLARLAPEDRLIVSLKVVHGFAYADISTMLGMPQPTVRSRVHRALRCLERLLTPGERDL